jgi:hypothetical protein
MLSLLAVNPNGVRQRVAIIDSPGASPRESTVAKIFRDEVKHAAKHLADIESAKRKLDR